MQIIKWFNFYIILNTLLFGIIYAQSGWQQQSPLPVGNTLTDVFFRTPNEGWAIGENGTVIYTGDEGNTWDIRSVDAPVQLNSVCFTTADSGWIVGNNGYVLRTVDGGQTWQYLTEPSSDNYYDVYFLTSRVGFYVGDNGMIEITGDSGENWTNYSVGTENPFYALSFGSSQLGWTVSSTNVMAYTLDGGANWQLYDSGLQARVLYSVYFLNDNYGWAVGDGGIVIHTIDGGVTWVEQTSPTGLSLTTVCFTDENRGWVASYYGGIYTTSDGGQSWTAQVSGLDINKTVRSIVAIDQNNLWAVGSAGIILHTIDSGNTWNHMRNGTASTLYSMDFIDRNNGWAMTGMGEIVHTMNGGTEWMVQQFGGVQPYAQLFFINEHKGWRVGDPALLEMTDDGGNSWSQQLTDLPFIMLHSVYFINEYKGWAVGDSSYIIHTEDGGTNWVTQYSDIPVLNRVFFADQYHGWAVGELGMILYTIDGGQTWITQTSGISERISDVYFTDTAYGWAVGDNGNILQTDNGGENWALQNSGVIHPLRSIQMINRQRGFIAGDSGTVLITRDGGNSWNLQNAGITENLYALSFVDANTGWIAGQGGSIYNTLDGGNEPVVILKSSVDKILFPQIEVGDSLNRIIQFKNPGILDLNISAIGIAGTNDSEFEILSDITTAYLQPGDSMIIEICFRPENDAAESDWLIINSNAYTSPDSISLTGNNSLLTTDTVPVVNQELGVTVSAPENFIPMETRLFYRMGGTTAWHSADMQSNASDYTATIPAYDVTIRGIEYFIRFSDGNTEITCPEENPMEHPEFIKTRAGSIYPDTVLSAGSYQMISFPLGLENPSLTAVFEDDFGSYDPTRWRLLRWNTQEAIYAEYPDMDKMITSGEACWLVCRESGNFDVDDGYALSTYNPARIILHPGWNQMANPYAFAVNWYNITNNSMVNMPVFWNGREYEYSTYLLHPWDGYFVYNPLAEPVELEILPLEAMYLKKEDAPLNKLFPDEFTLRIEAHGINSGITDVQNFAGMHRNATERFDVQDFPEAPPLTKQLNLSIIEEGMNLAGDFKPVSPEGALWQLKLTSLDNDSRVRLHFTLFGQLPENFHLYCLDKDNNCSLLIHENEVLVDCIETEEKNLVLIAGSQSFTEAHRGGIPLTPVRFSLKQNYPNPFNPQTRIDYSLARQCRVRIDVYNILGQKVITLVNDEKMTGLHSTYWNGVDSEGIKVGSGVYFYRVTAGDFTFIRKMLLLR